MHMVTRTVLTRASFSSCAVVMFQIREEIGYTYDGGRPAARQPEPEPVEPPSPEVCAAATSQAVAQPPPDAVQTTDITCMPQSVC